MNGRRGIICITKCSLDADSFLPHASILTDTCDVTSSINILFGRNFVECWRLTLVRCNPSHDNLVPPNLYINLAVT